MSADDSPAAPQAPADFTVQLERVFQGPLDLLLQLVREKELEIHAVSLAKVCDAYCAFVRSLDKVDVDEASDYLVLAATLLAIKSRSLLPQDEIEPDEDPFDPGEELVQQLLAYKALREAADDLGQRFAVRGRRLSAGGRWFGKETEEESAEEVDWDLGEVSLWDLLRVFQRLEEETGFSRPHRVRREMRPLRQFVEEVWERLEKMAATTLKNLLKEHPAGAGREEAVCYLVALLELARQRAVTLSQEEPFGDIHVRRTVAADVDLGQLDEGFDEGLEEIRPELEDLLADSTPGKPLN